MQENNFDYVDLGLSVMWATCNVGANKPEDCGLLFQFGRVDDYRYGDINNKFRTNKQNKQDTGNIFIPKTSSGKLYDTDDIRHTIYIVDHREPALAKVLETYDMSYHIDEDIKNRKFIIRRPVTGITVTFVPGIRI